MYKTLLFFSVVILCSINCFSQNKNQAKFWDHLLSNNRVEAGKIIDKNKSSDLDWLLLNEIYRNESGKITRNDDFLNTFLQKEDFEYYLFAFWNRTFLFDDYLEDGFNKNTFETLDAVMSLELNSMDLKDAILYLDAIRNRHNNNWDAYNNLNSKMNAIKDWQYCGSFENMNKSGLDKFYAPETTPSNNTDFDAKSNGIIQWYNGTNPIEAYQNFSNHNEYGSNVNYAQTFINSSIDQRVILRVGCGSAFKLFLNDVEIYKYDKDVSTDLNGYEVLVNLPKGNNRLLFKSAESNSNPYFMIAIFDENKKPLTSISFSNKPTSYNKSALLDLNPVEKKNDFESYFEAKIKSQPDNFLYTYALYYTFLRNSKYNEARDILMPHYEKYPKSSLLRSALMTTYNLEKDYTSSDELDENIERDDPEYYLPIINKVTEYDELSRLTMTEFEDYIEKLKNAFDSEIINGAADFLYYARKEDLSGIKTTLERLNSLAEKNENTNFKLRYAPLFDQLFQDQDRTIAALESISKENFSLSAENKLINYYDKKNEKDKVLDLIDKHYKEMRMDNSYLKRMVNRYVEYQMFDKALPYTEEMLQNYPYSFTTMELRGDILKQLGKSDEALEYYEKALKHNSGDSGLRKKINDISKKSNLINELVLEDAYDYITENRNKITTNNYGFNILLDESNIEVFEEGGFKYRYVYVYEVTSNSGIDTFKEYNLGLSGSYKFLKSELVKPDGNIVPADRRGSNLVFNDISIGDVVYIDYEGLATTTGRFYKDISDKIQFDSFHPMVLTSIDILIPKTSHLNYKYINGDLEPKISNKNGYKLYQWELKGAKTMDFAEDYMPNSVDELGYLHYNTIDSWNEIAEWYSDLVRTRIEVNSKVESEFKLLFPNGFKNLSENERAKIIYDYITSNFNYSYVSFKQSGFIPQKPSKTINTSLGDCKDFSTLFVTLAKMAELESNLVLVLTSDYGRNNLVLPSTDFNHCIVKVMIDGKEQFLELTNKYLPYKSLPTSLRGATALEIPFSTAKSDKTYDLIHLDNVNRIKSAINNKVTINLSQQNMNLQIATEVIGHNTPYYNEVFSEPNQDIIKKSISEDFESKLSDDFTLNTVSDYKKQNDTASLTFKSDLTLNKKLSSIGSIKILQLPILTHPYENSIIQLEERNYPIDYIQYESVDSYSTQYNIEIEEGQTFVEIPESKNFNFKNHKYSITYENPRPNQLNVTIEAVTPYDNVSPEDYPTYKIYVKNILETELEYIGFK
ncbi:transglutaminase domain-containing protein [Winogradskyella sp. 4-2091]|uniref:transglutaminase domain-containing protein n=1 Tax=Winogradskyella sp. 4-2091 TaxID=3381659 RepID=UPI003892C05F